jgi:hypothetical protein
MFRYRGPLTAAVDFAAIHGRATCVGSASRSLVAAEEEIIVVLRVTFAVVASLAFVSPGMAKDFQVGSATIVLPVPEGYCELSEQQSADARVIDVIEDLVAGTQNELLAVSADCGQLQAWRAGKLPTLDDYAQVQTPISGRDADVPRAATVKELCASMRAEGGKSIAEATPDLNTRVEAAVKGGKFNETGFLGVLAEDADVCYYGLQTKNRAENGVEETQVVVSATTVVKGRVVSYSLHTLYHDKDTATAALTRHRRNVTALLAANGG